MRDPLTRVRWLALTAFVVLYVNVTSGVLVRVSGSGLGCPDWPRCTQQRALPTISKHAVLEYSNRLVAFVAIVVTLALAIVAYRGRDVVPTTQRRLAYGIGALTLAQGPLGAITVLSGLNPLVVMCHFLVFIVAMALATILVVDVLGWSAAWPRPRWVAPAGSVLAAWALALIVSGAVVTMSGTHPGTHGDEFVKRLWNLLDATYWHVRIAASFVAVLALGLWALTRLEPPRRVGVAGASIVALTGVQLVIGEVQWRNQLPAWLVLLHVMTATLLWIAVVAFGRLLAPARAGAASEG